MENETIFEKFVREYQNDCKDQVKDNLKRLVQIGGTTGARSSFFKQCPVILFVHRDTSEKKLRLYCMRMGMDVVILGGGGEKSKTRSWQDDEKLTKEANLHHKVLYHLESSYKKLQQLDLLPERFSRISYKAIRTSLSLNNLV